MGSADLEVAMRPLPTRTRSEAARPTTSLRPVACPSGFACLEDQALLGLWLEHALPGQAVDAVAAALIERFGALGDIAAAGTAELGRIPGMGSAAIRDLKLLREFCVRLSRSAAC